jgi:thioredoxin reductase (NADPH)
MRPELLIVGAGPAGVSAALWGHSQGLSLSVIEAAPAPGGQLHHVHFHPPELPGVSAGDGPAMAATFATQLREAGVPVRYHTAAASLGSVDGARGRPWIETTGGERLEAEAVLIATGARRRRLEVPGERELEDRGVSYSATRDRARLAGRNLVVVGGGDAAFENALILADAGCRVLLALRDAPRARREFRERVARESRIRVIQDVEVKALLGTDRLEAVEFEGPGGAFAYPAEGVVIKVGVIPNTEWCLGALDHDDEGYLRVDPRFRTSRHALWAAGDVVRPALLAITVAFGTAALAVADVRATLRGE